MTYMPYLAEGEYVYAIDKNGIVDSSLLGMVTDSCPTDPSGIQHPDKRCVMWPLDWPGEKWTETIELVENLFLVYDPESFLSRV